MGCGKLQPLPEEFLVAEVEGGQVARPARVDDSARRDRPPVRQSYAGGRDQIDGGAGDERLRGKRRAQGRVQPLALDTLIALRKAATVVGEAHVMPIPGMADERGDQPAMLRGDIAGEAGPDMVAAEMGIGLDQGDA